jgi:hypothetical protein
VATYYPQLHASRILYDSDRSSASSADDSSVTGISLNTKFIVACQIGYNGKDTAASAYKLQWRDVTDSGTFADVASTGEIKWAGSSAVLTDGTAVTSTTRRCTARADQTWQNGLENVGDNLLPDSGSLDLASDYYTELQWALDPAGANYLHQYEFRLWNNTSAATVGTCVAKLTTAGSDTSLTNVSIDHALTNDTILLEKGAVNLKLSSNIAASAATATTAQLTAPSGKSSSTDFTAGKISDDTNPVTVDIGSAKYTELEWSLIGSDILATGDEIEFKVTKAGVDITTYSVTPKWTVGTSGTQLTMVEGTHVLSNDAIALTQAQVLVVQDGANALTNDPIVLAQQQTLTGVSESFHALTNDTINLTQHKTLVVLDGLHAHTPDPIVLGVAIALVVQDGAHVLSSDPIVLVQQHALIINEVTHAHSSDPIVVVRNIILSVYQADHPIVSAVTIDFYDIHNFNDYGYEPGDGYVSQSFTGNGLYLTDAEMYGVPQGSGNIQAFLYAHSGTYGSTGVPSGEVLATSNEVTLTVSGLSVLTRINFNFSSPYLCQNGVYYCFVIRYSNDIYTCVDSSSPTHSGNLAIREAG